MRSQLIAVTHVLPILRMPVRPGISAAAARRDSVDLEATRLGGEEGAGGAAAAAEAEEGPA